MKIVALIARVLLGLGFAFSGLAFFFHWVPAQLPSEPNAAAFAGALFSSGYIVPVKALEAAGGLLVLSGRFAPLGLLLLGPVIANILLFDIYLDRKGLPIGLLVAVLSLIVLFQYRSAFAGIFKPAKGS